MTSPAFKRCQRQGSALGRDGGARTSRAPPRRIGPGLDIGRPCKRSRLIYDPGLTGRPPTVRERHRSGGRSSGVERNLAKVEVEGSNPFARSISLSLADFAATIGPHLAGPTRSGPWIGAGARLAPGSRPARVDVTPAIPARFRLSIARPGGPHRPPLLVGRPRSLGAGLRMKLHEITT